MAGTSIFCSTLATTGRSVSVKDTGNRVFNHLASARQGENGPKSARIREIYQAGLEPKRDILRHGLDDASAFHVEAAALHSIDLMGGSLTNLVPGHGVADDMSHLIGISVDHLFSQGSQTPFRFLNCG